MKRWGLFVLVIILLSVTAIAEYETDAIMIEGDSTSFSFRNDVKWGDDLGSVQASEGKEGQIQEWNSWQQLFYSNVSVSNYSADEFCYMFNENGLHIIFYGFWGMGEDDEKYLKDALTAKYGEPITSDKARLITLLNIIGPEDYQIDKLKTWQLEDGTYIAAFNLDGYFYIMYFDEDDLLLSEGIYNIAGL